MTGKEKFKAVKKEYIEGIMTEYSVDKDKAYSMLANVFNEPKAERTDENE